MVGMVTLPTKVQNADMPMQAFVLKIKAPPLIMGFLFWRTTSLWSIEWLGSSLGRMAKDTSNVFQTSAATHPLHWPIYYHPDAFVV